MNIDLPGTITAGTPDAQLVADLFLDGVKQRKGSVTAFNIAEGWIERGVRLADDSGYAFDLEAQDFVLERVSGKVVATLRAGSTG